MFFQKHYGIWEAWWEQSGPWWFRGSCRACIELIAISFDEQRHNCLWTLNAKVASTRRFCQLLYRNRTQLTKNPFCYWVFVNSCVFVHQKKLQCVAKDPSVRAHVWETIGLISHYKKEWGSSVWRCHGYSMCLCVKYCGQAKGNPQGRVGLTSTNLQLHLSADDVVMVIEKKRAGASC